MSGKLTIWEAGEAALKELGGIAAIEEIYDKINKLGLYSFGVDQRSKAVHILDTELKRKSSNTPRTDRASDAVFELSSDGKFKILNEKEQMKTMTKAKAAGTKRIHRAKDKEQIINALMSDNVGVFKEIWRLLLFAAQLGYHANRREPLASVDTGKGIDQTTFGNCPSWPGVAYLMGLVENDSSDVLQGTAEAEDERLTIFQEYANGGLSLIEEQFDGRLIDLDGLVDLINRSFSDGSAQEPDLDLSI
ncbi:MAG: dnd system-associated protein 4 [Akkermansiaceae bacterium]|jgi:dnd system-associated protein 4